MLKAFRDNLKHISWVLPIVIAVFIGFFLVDFTGTTPGGYGGGANTAATVGGEQISFSRFQRAYEAREQALRSAYGDAFTSETARQIGLPLQVMNELIAEKILRDEAARIGLAVTDAELRQAILEQPAFRNQDGRFIGREEYGRILRRAGYTVDSFESAMRGDLLTGKLRTILAESVYVSAAEVERTYRDQAERAEIRYLQLPLSLYAGEVSVTEEQLTSFFAERRDEFRLPERRRVSYLLVDPDALEPTVEVSDKEIAAYYDEHREEYAQDERVRARHILLRVSDDAAAPAVEQRLAAIRARIEAGEDFAALAGELSDDPGSKARGGDLGYFGRGDMIGAFEDAAFGAAPGELVGPVRTNFGYHLIEVLDRQPGGVRTADEVRDEIYAVLAAERAASLAESKARELAQQARREKPAAAEGLAELAGGEPGVTLQRPEPFGRDDQVPGIGRGTPFTSTAFDLEPGETSEAVAVTAGWAVLRLEEVLAPRLPELAEVRSPVESAYRRGQQRRLAEARLEEAKRTLAEGSSFDEVAGELGAEPKESGPFGRDGQISGLGRQPALAAAALALEPGAVGGPLEVGGSVLLFEVTDRQRFDPQQFAAASEGTRAELEQRRFGELLTQLIESRRKKLDVRFDKTFVDNFQVPPETA